MSSLTDVGVMGAVQATYKQIMMVCLDHHSSGKTAKIMLKLVFRDEEMEVQFVIRSHYER